MVLEVCFAGLDFVFAGNFQYFKSSKNDLQAECWECCIRSHFGKAVQSEVADLLYILYLPFIMAHLEYRAIHQQSLSVEFTVQMYL